MDGVGYIITIGGVCFDEYYDAPHWIDEGDKCVITHKASIVGGMIANAACVFAGYGNKTYFVDVMNDGPGNQKLLEDLRGYSINTEFVNYADMPDSKCFIILTPGERSIFVIDRGPAQLHFNDKQRDLFKNAAYVYTTISDFYRVDDALNFAASLRANGVKLVFDVEPSTFHSADDPLFGEADILLFNRQGIEKYHGGGDWQSSAKALINNGKSAVIVSLGSEGCYGITTDEEVRLDGIQVPVVDTTGAGDTFNASFLHCHMRGKDLLYSLRFANAAASHCVSVMGARGGVGSVASVERLMSGLY